MSRVARIFLGLQRFVCSLIIEQANHVCKAATIIAMRYSGAVAKKANLILDSGSQGRKCTDIHSLYLLCRAHMTQSYAAAIAFFQTEHTSTSTLTLPHP